MVEDGDNHLIPEGASVEENVGESAPEGTYIWLDFIRCCNVAYNLSF